MKFKFKKVEVDGKAIFLSEKKIAELEAAKVEKKVVKSKKETPVVVDEEVVNL